MKAIKYKAKRLDNGEWVEGQYFHRTVHYGEPRDDHFILSYDFDPENDLDGDFHKIDIETICAIEKVKCSEAIRKRDEEIGEMLRIQFGGE